MYFSLHYLSYTARLVIWLKNHCLDSVAIVEVGHDHTPPLVVGGTAVGTDIIVEVADEHIVGAAVADGNLYMSHLSN